MSDKQTVITYDFKKNMKAEINPAFIEGLQSIYMRYITEFYEDVENFAELVKDFNDLITDPKGAEKKNRVFTPTESELYTLYALINLLKGYAHEQGLAKEEEVPIDKDKFKEITDKAVKDNKNPIEILNQIADEFKSLS